MSNPASRDLNPYVAGVGVGVVLLLAFVLVGRGLSMIGGFSSVVSSAMLHLWPQAANHGAFLAERATAPPPWQDWTVLMVVGVLVGSAASSALGGRMHRPSNTTLASAPGGRRRAALAMCGGVLMGLGAKIGGGCTSGQILSGGAMLGVGSWVFMGAVFAAAYTGAWCLRRHWR